ncbi:MAG TPA: GlxA family transcriptional regulator [Amaricoccus sp.]|nr:GlxA family transcriptional regulator [Amaricoccus sp.]HMQ93941.1 GlxA family transcriptional regulator [Amaricoccus sp.]HMR52087.1 GlxA family transcriptional regulator [Amaricoccus sp.]HMR61465.1 GlxA family transcriptional regulator [Amaricoccus sp.]HMT98889.1 GlxA family transcriptional regulator [Amaricoccus sp.]
MAESRDDRPEPFVFLLLENFTLIAFACAIEPLRLANRMAGRMLYEWRIVTADGGPVTASNGVTLQADAPMQDLARDTTIMVVGGQKVKSAVSRPVLTWLRREARRGLAVGALCNGAQIVAQAGLLDGRRCTIHWENRDGFEEEFPQVDLSQNIFVIDRDRYSAAGGTASTDLMLKLIARRHGTDLANLVADQMIHTAIRSDKDEQRLSIPTRIGVRHPRLANVIHAMEDSIEEPISPALLAEDVGMSTRQLERLFRRYLNRSPKRYYMELRLGKARNLLQQTDMSVINVALACGFTSPSHFSKCYRALYKTTPYRERGASDTSA